MSIFEKASRTALRFESIKGPLTVEDLWLIPLTSATGKVNLDDIARGLFLKLQSTANISFVKKEEKADEQTQLGFDIVKHIIDVRVTEQEAASVKRANTEKKQKLLELLDRKQNEALSQLTEDELRAQINAL